MKKVMVYLLPALLIITASFNRTKKDEVVNYLNTSETLTVNGQEYKLSWSSRPGTNYYKQEYLPAGENPDRYKSMLMVEYLLIDTPAKNIVGVKINELRERKKKDAVANFMVQKKSETGEYLLDFILSDGDGRNMSTVELNAYRYKNYTDKAGHKGVLLFGLSKRAYDDDVTPFMRNLKNERMNIINAVAKSDFPRVEVK
ncbi:hypothetical protein KXD93_11725 [Mucilaginibacter sp. BJC16-A38]|uniref:hypothetical protein n=1 Tax=Mucilaginibacter phenanthrenivorans TaxID=1234842 RepID=UPI0021576520|nr:hypothetical protein [Mucilaginibacter phenanthrenivorans]MCR8558320.1 hypothetical protein [Mucilaginibacter phenanthrenivorans]